MLFKDLDIHPDLKKAALECGFAELTEIQEKCFEPGNTGRDIAGISQTGTGKTVAFLLPILKKLIENPTNTTAALIVTPTRELCLQIAEEIEKLCKYTAIQSVAIYGGEDYHKQESRLANNPAIIVATPGRLIDFMKQKKLQTNDVEFLVLDEADRMLDMGFIRDIRYIMKHVSTESQIFLFSATLSYYIMRIASDFMKNPVEVRIESDSVAVDKIEQYLFHLSRDEKNVFLINQILSLTDPRIIIFTNYKHSIERIVRQLHKYGISAVGISSLLDQKKRIRLLKNFKLGFYKVLVATDVASRGLDVDDITHVINYDLPQDSESYVHRIGRTARAGKSGISYSYCSEDDYENLPRIQRYIDQKIPVGEVVSDWIHPPQGSFSYFKDPESKKKSFTDKPQRPKQSSKRKVPTKTPYKKDNLKHVESISLVDELKRESQEKKSYPKPRKRKNQYDKKKAPSDTYEKRQQVKPQRLKDNYVKSSQVKRHTIKTTRIKSKETPGLLNKIKSIFKRNK